jgi:ATP-binding cassette subfamily B protein
MTATTGRRRWLVPEVVQTSAMDCGPATLKALLEGFGISASYGRLREACQTDVDGTSINALEEAAVQLGLEAEQILIPHDHLLLDEADALPAIVTLWSPGKLIHFVLAWRRLGSFVQVMDPSTGRRWPTVRRLREQLYVHEMQVDAAGWLEWASSDDFARPLARRLVALGVHQRDATRLIQTSLDRGGWRPLAGLDAAVRMASDLTAGGGLRRSTATRLVRMLVDRSGDDPAVFGEVVPDHYWSSVADSSDLEGQHLRMRGAVIVHVRGRRTGERAAAIDPETSSASGISSGELAAALAEPPASPGRDLVHLLRSSGAIGNVVLFGAAAMAAIAVVGEALVLRALIDRGDELLRTGRHVSTVAVIAAFLAAVMLLEWSLTAGALRMGRRFESHLRLALLQKIPRLGDRYFHSRLVSDMADRSHSIHTVRTLPMLAIRFVQTCVELAVTVGAIGWIDPQSALIALPTAVLVVGLPFVAQPVLAERDLRFRAHAAALMRVVLDSALGLLPIRAHSAERSVRRQHESLLTEWARAGLGLHDIERRISTAQNLVGFGGAAWMVWSLAAQPSRLVPLLLAYWALRVPMLGQDLTFVMRQYPSRRNVMLRLLEPLGAPSETADDPRSLDAASSFAVNDRDDEEGIALELRDVKVRVAGHAILSDINLSIPSGAHVAIVGASGAGKSTLVGLFLGWAGSVSGSVSVDGVTLDAARVTELRQQTAWVDPAVQLWNRSLLENLLYGNAAGNASVGHVVEEGDLTRVVERLPEGTATRLGEGGGLLSGGEGQRVRFARALLRRGTRLVILDEPFRGLDRPTRRRLLEQARSKWRNATLLCVTHDVDETRAFERVLVVDDGRIVEDDTPHVLAAQPGSQYAAMLRAEQTVREAFWGHPAWRRFWFERGRLHQS